MKIGLSAVAAVALMLAGTGADAQRLTREVVTPPGATGPAPPFSPAVKVGNTLYLAGQVGGEAGPEIRDQVAAALKKVRVLVETAGSTIADVDKCTVFLTRPADFAPMNEVWRGVFPDKPPARTTVIVAALAGPTLLVEIDCIAHL
jgi:2-iminobutanoate/2-iminopropanoate deaminase